MSSLPFQPLFLCSFAEQLFCPPLFHQLLASDVMLFFFFHGDFAGLLLAFLGNENIIDLVCNGDGSRWTEAR